MKGAKEREDKSAVEEDSLKRWKRGEGGQITVGRMVNSV